MARPDRYWLRGLILTLGLYVIVRAIAALQIVAGMRPIIFGLPEVLRYPRERDWREQRRYGHH